jgi:hypothetical protein
MQRARTTENTSCVPPQISWRLAICGGPCSVRLRPVVLIRPLICARRNTIGFLLLSRHAHGRVTISTPLCALRVSHLTLQPPEGALFTRTLGRATRKRRHQRCGGSSLSSKEQPRQPGRMRGAPRMPSPHATLSFALQVNTLCSLCR